MLVFSVKSVSLANEEMKIYGLGLKSHVKSGYRKPSQKLRQQHRKQSPTERPMSIHQDLSCSINNYKQQIADEGKRTKFRRSRYVQDRTRIDVDTVTSTTAVNDNANTNPPTTDTGNTDDTDTSSKSSTLRPRLATAITTTRSTAVNPNTETARM